MTHHKRSLLHFWHNNKAVILAMLIPAFIVGWQLSKKAHVATLIKQISKFVFVTALTNVKRKLIVDISTKLAPESTRKK
ncbi:hypothetical protein [Legionella adelaidensis]|uniref:hypothetical protein n=1 Tax=Legionella adelaidensis TaxID=45056 RepID=UPI0012EE080B|nr:hypothetical protein [Legionella adelaidensis]